MAVRQDTAQLKVEFITDENRKLASTLLTTKQYTDEIGKSSAAIKKYQQELARVGQDEVKRAAVIAKITAEEQKLATATAAVVAEGKKVAGLDLSRVAPQQLVDRANQLRIAMRNISQSAPEFKALDTELGAINGRLREMKQTSAGLDAKGGASGGGLFQRILGVAGGIGLFQLVTSSLRSIVNVGRESLKLVDIQLKADAQVAQAIKSTGGVAGKTLEDLKKQAGDLQKVTLFGDEATQGAQAILLTFTNIRDEIFDNTIPIIQDMSTALGQDLKSSSIQVGKALNDPVQGVTALSKVGVSFTEAQKKVIKSLVETGDVAGAQRLILKELETEFGGSAKAAASAGLGGFQQLENRVSDLKEGFGLLISNGLQRIAPFLEKVVSFFEQLTERLISGNTATGEYATAVNFVAGALNIVAKVLQLVALGLEGAYNYWVSSVDAITGFIEKVRELPIVGELFEAFIITPLRFVFDAISSLPAAWAGFQAATKQTIINIGADFQDFLLRAQVFIKVLERTLSISPETKTRLSNEIRDLENQRTVAAKAGKTIGQAYVDARDAVLTKSATTSNATAPGAKKPVVIPEGEDPEAAKKRIEDRLKNELQAIEIGIQRRELLLENERIKGLINDKQYNDRLVQITEEGLRKKLDVYRVFHRDQTNEALKLANELAVIEQGGTLKKVAIDVIAPGGVSSVASQAKSGGTDEALAIQDQAERAREQALAQRFQSLIITEQDYELQRLELKKQALAEEILILQAGGPAYSAAVRKKEEDAYKIEQEISAKKVENAKRTEDLKVKVQQAGFQAAAGLFSLAADLLAEDEKSRKKNATAIKAFQSAEVITNGILEAQRSYAESVKTFGVPAGPILGAIFAGLAVGRSIVAVNKINATKFYRGGFTGSGYGAPDETGHIPAGIVHAGEYVATRQQVNDPETGPVIRWLNDRRLRGYASGGFVAPNTTPSSSISFSPGAGSAAPNLDAFMNAVARFERIVEQFPTEVKSRVVYTELETAGTVLNTVRDDASL